ncbi:ELMO domain-containing protein C [Gossypium australe]|uniref:ELMO domain-containing protein C n=1 Tax=Gossypium australe TaxID=47621 RepID=A0A5B6X089_9ROSI|nr:ELMO domain-containing protein C [Gossypium australe]
MRSGTSIGTVRRRLHHSDVGGLRSENYETSGLDGLDEPLLGKRDNDDKHSEGKVMEEIWDDERKKEQLHWTLLFSNLIAQWAQWIANLVFGSGSFIVRHIPLLSNTKNRSNPKLIVPTLSPLQEERLRNLQQRLGVPFDGSRVDHQDALKLLWRLAYPNRELPPLKSELWKDMGWQGPDPSTDFRGGGFISLENLIFFAKKYPESFQRLLHKQDGNRADWEYPFAVAGINISFMLTQMLDLQSGNLNSELVRYCVVEIIQKVAICYWHHLCKKYWNLILCGTKYRKPSSLAGIRFLKLLGEDEMAFDDLYCVAFQMMDAQWLVKRASYMEFNDVLKSTRTQLERELSLEDVSSVKDLPAYNLLRR